MTQDPADHGGLLDQRDEAQASATADEFADVAAIVDDAADGTSARYDAILMDVDNGPDGIVRSENTRIYSLPACGQPRPNNKGPRHTIWFARTA